MACLGVLFSIDQTTVDYIRQLSTTEERIDYVREFLEEDYFENYPIWIAELVKSWDPLHRSLTDGSLAWVSGDYPLNHVILGGETLCANENYIIMLKSKEQVADIAAAVIELTQEQLRSRYFKINPEEYDGEVEEEDFEHMWQWFEASKSFWKRAASENRCVLFTVDQ